MGPAERPRTGRGVARDRVQGPPHLWTERPRLAIMGGAVEEGAPVCGSSCSRSWCRGWEELPRRPQRRLCLLSWEPFSPARLPEARPVLGFWELPFLLSPSVNWWESCLRLWSHVTLRSLCFSLFLFLHPLLSFPLSPSRLFRSLLSLVVVLLVQLRAQVASLSLPRQRAARQSLSPVTWKAEQRLRVTNPSRAPCGPTDTLPRLAGLGDAACGPEVAEPVPSSHRPLQSRSVSPCAQSRGQGPPNVLYLTFGTTASPHQPQVLCHCAHMLMWPPGSRGLPVLTVLCDVR